MRDLTDLKIVVVGERRVEEGRKGGAEVDRIILEWS